MYASTQFIFYIPSSRENMAKFGFILAQELVCSEPISRKKILILHLSCKIKTLLQLTMSEMYNCREREREREERLTMVNQMLLRERLSHQFWINHPFAPTVQFSFSCFPRAPCWSKLISSSMSIQSFHVYHRAHYDFIQNVEINHLPTPSL